MVNDHPLKAVILLNSETEAGELASKIADLGIFADIKIALHFDEFINHIQTQKMDCFFLEIDYRGFSVVDLTEKLRKSNKYRRTPLVFVSDKKDRDILHRYSALNVDMVITRPFVFDDINSQLLKVLDKRFSRIIPEHYNVLVLDNNPDIIDLMTLHLDEFKHTKFDTCLSIAEAKKLVDKNDYDLLLLDWNLDDGTCLDLIEFVRSKKDRPRLDKALIMAITARNDVDDIITLLKYNVKDCLIKPFDHKEFEEKLIYALEKHIKKT